MFLSARHKPTLREAIRHRVFDRDTGEEIPRVIWADDETGRYRQHLVDENGKYILNAKRDAVLSKIFTRNIELRRVKD